MAGGALAVAQAEAGHVIDDVVHKLRRLLGGVCVVEPHNQAALVAVREDLVQQRRLRVPDVEVP